MNKKSKDNHLVIEGLYPLDRTAQGGCYMPDPATGLPLTYKKWLEYYKSNCS